MGKQGPDQLNWDESPCLPLMHELESLHCSAQFLPPGLQLLVHSLSLIYAVCNLLQISLGHLCMNHMRCHMIGLMHVAKTHSRQHTRWSRHMHDCMHIHESMIVHE